MKDLSLMPVVGMNTVGEDAGLHRTGKEPRHYLRDALNVNITPAGKVDMRAGVRQVSATPYQSLWTSPLHGETFGALGGEWVKINTSDWTHEALATIGEGDVSHELLNNRVCVAGPAGVFTYDGVGARRLTIDTPPAPMLALSSGSLAAGKYGVALAWVRDGIESAPSDIAFAEVGEGGSLDVTLPLCMDPTVTTARLYLTKPDGGELARLEDCPVGALSVSVPALGKLGMPPQFLNRAPMPSGRFLKLWAGRLLTARANVLRFSEALAYHLHDERHGFVQLPQRITFVQPVAGGIWVGQVDHVAFLSGTSPDGLALQRKTGRAPVPGSAILVDAAHLGAELSNGGAETAMWLAENGYVVGTAQGEVVELHANVMSDITANSGTTVVVGGRATSVVL